MSFGDPFVTPGGKGIPFHSSVRVRLTPSGKIEEGNDVIAVGVNAKTVKNRIAPPFRKTHFTIYFNKGINDHEDWPGILIDKGIMTKKHGGRNGNTYVLEFQDKELSIPARDWSKTLKSDSELYENIKKMVEEAMILNLTEEND